MRIPAKNLSLSATIECGQVFNYSIDEKNGFYFAVHDGSVIRIKQEGDYLQFETFPKKDNSSFVKNYFNLQQKHSIPKTKNKKRLRLLNGCSGLRIINQEPFECLISYILSQQSSIPRMRKNVFEISEHFGKELRFEGRCFYSFPTPEALASAKLSDLKKFRIGYRNKYVLEAAKKIANGYDLEKLRGMEYGKAKEELMQFNGVGEKVADCVLLFSLGFTEAFPIDTWIRKIMLKLFFKNKMVSDKKIREFAREEFGKSAGFVQQCLYARRKELLG